MIATRSGPGQENDHHAARGPVGPEGSPRLELLPEEARVGEVRARQQRELPTVRLGRGPAVGSLSRTPCTVSVLKDHHVE